jgi:acyl carrier protein
MSEEWGVRSEEIQDDDSPHSSLLTPHSSLDAGQPRSSQEIRAWLIGEIAHRLKIPVSEVDPCQPFASLGMDSLTTMMLAGDLETWLGRKLAPTLLYDLPNIEAISRELAEGTTGAEQQEPSPVEPIEISTCMYPWEAALDGPGSIDGQAAQELLGRLDQLSGEEMTDLLQLMGAGETPVSPSAA